MLLCVSIMYQLPSCFRFRTCRINSITVPSSRLSPHDYPLFASGARRRVKHSLCVIRQCLRYAAWIGCLYHGLENRSGDPTPGRICWASRNRPLQTTVIDPMRPLAKGRNRQRRSVTHPTVDNYRSLCSAKCKSHQEYVEPGSGLDASFLSCERFKDYPRCSYQGYSS
jgi:hypothetical protein